MLDSHALSQTVKYWPELLWDNTVQTIQANGATLNTPIINWGEFDQDNLFVNLVNVTTMQQLDMQLNVTTEVAVSPSIYTMLRPNQSPGPGAWVAWKQLQVTLQNLYTASYLTQADYGLWVWPMNNGLRYAFNMLAQGQTRAGLGAGLPSNLRDLIDDGLRPLTGAQTLSREDMSFVIQEITPQPTAVNVGQATVIYTQRVPAGRAYVLMGMTCDPSIGGTQTLAEQQTAGLTLNISRDQQQPYLTPILAGLSATRSVPFWIPALTTLTVALTAAQNFAEVPIVLQVADIPLSTLNRIRWGQIAQAATNQTLWNMVLNSGY